MFLPFVFMSLVVGAPTGTKSLKGGVAIAVKMKTEDVHLCICGLWLQVGLGTEKVVSCLRNSPILNVFGIPRGLYLEGNLLTLAKEVLYFAIQCFNFSPSLNDTWSFSHMFASSVSAANRLYFALLEINLRPTFTIMSNLLLQKSSRSYHNTLFLKMFCKQRVVLLEHYCICIRNKSKGP